MSFNSRVDSSMESTFPFWIKSWVAFHVKKRCRDEFMALDKEFNACHQIHCLDGIGWKFFVRLEISLVSREFQYIRPVSQRSRGQLGALPHESYSAGGVGYFVVARVWSGHHRGVLNCMPQ